MGSRPSGRARTAKRALDTVDRTSEADSQNVTDNNAGNDVEPAPMPIVTDDDKALPEYIPLEASDTADNEDASASARPSKGTAAPRELEDPERLARTAFVGNVPSHVTRKALKALFKPFGAVEAVRLRGVVAANPQLPKKTALLARRMHKDCDTILAYVVFKRAVAEDAETPQTDQENATQSPSPVPQWKKTTHEVSECVRNACKGLNLHILDGKHIRVTPAQHTRGPVRRSVFVGNLPFDTTEEDLIELFQDAGKDAGSALVGVRVTRDAETGMGRGIGYVSFDDELGVRAVLNRQGEFELKGRVLRFERATKEKKRNTKTYKRNAKMAAEKEKAEADTKRKKKKRRADGRNAPGVTRKIRKERTEKKIATKIKHAARKERKQQKT